LVITSDQGAVVITGCAHPGIGAVADAAARQADAPIALLAGGFHLFQASAETVSRTAEELHSSDVRHIMPTHCTGTQAMEKLEELFGRQFVQGGVGQVICFDSDGRPVTA
jgi:7,8-dihydropterin-6-yl-methyl-4-(beta-D-ribofuranosyl)aminobenzene 5'-phosphate synthase